MKRPYALLKHKTCESIFKDVCLHEEKDERYCTIYTLPEVISLASFGSMYIFARSIALSLDWMLHVVHSKLFHPFPGKVICQVSLTVCLTVFYLYPWVEMHNGYR